MIPIATSGAAVVWKRLAKEYADWQAEDCLVAFELLIAGVAAQMTILFADVALEVGNYQIPGLGKRIFGELVLLLVISNILPALALAMRSHRANQQLTREVAIRISVAAAAVLVALFLIDFFLPSIVV